VIGAAADGMWDTMEELVEAEVGKTGAVVGEFEATGADVGEIGPLVSGVAMGTVKMRPDLKDWGGSDWSRWQERRCDGWMEWM